MLKVLQHGGIAILALNVLGFSGAATAQEPMVFELPMQGIQIESNGSGEWERLYATGIQPVEFPDRRGISTAQRIAEQRAKAEIVKFFDQNISAETIVNEMESSTQTSTRQQGSAGESFGKDSQRVLATSLSEVLRSYSSSNLRGVMVLETGYDEVKEEAWVKVGISRNSVAMAGSARASVSGSRANTGIGNDAGGEGRTSTNQPSELRTGRDLP